MAKNVNKAVVEVNTVNELTNKEVKAITTLVADGVKAGLVVGTVAGKIVKFIGEPSDLAGFNKRWAMIRTVLKDQGIFAGADKATGEYRMYIAASMAKTRYGRDLGLLDDPAPREGANARKEGGKATSYETAQAAVGDAPDVSKQAATVTLETFGSLMAAVPSAVLREWAKQFGNEKSLLGFFGYSAGVKATEVTKVTEGKKK